MGKVGKKKAGGGAVLEDSRLIVTFADITRDDYEALRSAETREDVRTLLAEALKVNVDDGFHALILMDFHLANYIFCLDNNWNAEKTSTVISILKVVHETAVAQSLPKTKSYDLFRSLVAKHSLQRPPYCVGVFDSHECQKVMEFGSATFFQHYEMYMYAYKARYEVDIRLIKERLVPEMLSTFDFTEIHVCDPQSVPELASFFPQTMDDSAAFGDIFDQAERDEKKKVKKAGAVSTVMDEALDEVMGKATHKLGDMTETYVAQANLQQTGGA
jgi:hypothetical protein